MVLFSEIKTNHSQYGFVEKLFVSAFPEEERRKEEEQREMIDFNPFVHCVLLSDVDETPLGFITYWRFDAFTYVEHFAIAPEYRNRGIGSEILSSFLEMQHRSVVLEAEFPTASALALRRIGFYLRNDFVQLPDAYVQPPYPGRGCQGVPMVLLLFAEDGAKHPSFCQIRNLLYHEVYGVMAEKIETD